MTHRTQKSAILCSFVTAKISWGRSHTGHSAGASTHSFWSCLPRGVRVHDNLLPAPVWERRPAGKPRAPAFSVQCPVPSACAGAVSERPSWVPQACFVRVTLLPHTGAPPHEPRAHMLHGMTDTIFRRTLQQHVNVQSFHPNLQVFSFSGNPRLPPPRNFPR